MLQEAIFNIGQDAEFDALALRVFEFQYKECKVYREFCDYLNKSPKQVKDVLQIPFLPIEFFRSRQVICQGKTPEVVFKSSGTTSQQSSQHLVTSKELYIKSFLNGFESVYGKVKEQAVLGLLPSYLERQDSSLVYMVDHLIKASNNKQSGFYLDEFKSLSKTIQSLEAQKQPYVLFGVSFALLDFIDAYPQKISYGSIIETGGMKGRRKEIIRSQLHKLLKAGFGVEEIHSEYGMTELLSQAYSTSHEIFHSPPWMRVYIREPNDPFNLISERTGGVNVIDLANLYSCSFIATQDLGKKISSHSFQILGRFDYSDLRGCNLMVL